MVLSLSMYKLQLLIVSKMGLKSSKSPIRHPISKDTFEKESAQCEHQRVYVHKIDVKRNCVIKFEYSPALFFFCSE